MSAFGVQLKRAGCDPASPLPTIIPGPNGGKVTCPAGWYPHRLPFGTYCCYKGEDKKGEIKRKEKEEYEAVYFEKDGDRYKIYNPITKRLVYADSSVGKEVLKGISDKTFTLKSNKATANAYKSLTKK